jgi:phenylpyruvate tautomerase PptA (4-oxalocrotonate tautomerase family)
VADFGFLPGRGGHTAYRHWFLPNRRNAVARQVKEAPQMPIYQCTTPAGTVPDAVRPQIAKEITRLHVEATNAPPSFVHVIILDVPPFRQRARCRRLTL